MDVAARKELAQSGFRKRKTIKDIGHEEDVVE
jgi:hypothetical protein